MNSPMAVLFDFDGVIVNSEPLYEKVEREQFARLNIYPTETEWAMFKGISSAAFFGYVKEHYLPDTDIEALNREWQHNLLDEFQRSLDYVDGFREFQTMISGLYRSAIVTSAPRQIIEWILHNTAIAPGIDLLITADDIRYTKPHPEPYLTAAKMLDVPIQRCIVVEDSINGIRSGRASGAAVVGLATSLPQHYLEEADLIINHFKELTPERLEALIQKGGSYYG